MGSTDKFCLRWNDFHDNISGTFRELRKENDFFDVTLACATFDESANSHDLTGLPRTSHKTVRAHKLILSACSVFFKDLLKSMNNSGTNVQPLIYLSGIEFEDLQCILDFMYFGEVNIAQEKLNTFLAVAEELRVKGLTQNEAATKDIPLPIKRPLASGSALTKSLPNFSAKRAKLVKRPREFKAETSPEPKMEPGEEIGETSSSSLQHQFSESFGGDQSMDEFGSANDDFLESLNESTTGTSEAAGSDGNKAWRDLQMEQLESGYWRCNICNQEVQYRHSLQRHIESKHMKCEPIPCPYCDRSFNTKNSIQTHISKYHRKLDRPMTD